jgi:hypothetical protein
MDQTPEGAEPVLVTAEGPWGGPVYRHRGAEIRCDQGGHACAPLSPGHPLDGMTFGVVGPVVPLVDLWVVLANT